MVAWWHGGMVVLVAWWHGGISGMVALVVVLVSVRSGQQRHSSPLLRTLLLLRSEDPTVEHHASTRLLELSVEAHLSKSMVGE